MLMTIDKGEEEAEIFSSGTIFVAKRVKNWSVLVLSYDQEKELYRCYIFVDNHISYVFPETLKNLYTRVQ